MLTTETAFDVNSHHIHLEIIVVNIKGIEFSVDAILDTGAPRTEFSDEFLFFTGFIDSIEENSEIQPSLQSQKYDKITIPQMQICGHYINDFEVFVSAFEETWGIDALIGLDFFRKFLVAIDYSKGKLRTRAF